MAYAKAVLRVDPEPALKTLADKIALRASAEDIQLKVETAPRFSSQSIGTSTRSSGRTNQVLATRTRNTSLEEVTPAMDIWPWLVRHAGWLLERYHVKGNKKTPFEDCFGKPYQSEQGWITRRQSILTLLETRQSCQTYKATCRSSIPRANEAPLRPAANAKRGAQCANRDTLM